MPIYEFYCRECNCLYSFFSKSVNTEKVPVCPTCATPLARQISMFAVTGRALEPGSGDDCPIDEGKMEKAMALLEQEAGSINGDDPQQAAVLMRKLSDMTGLKLGEGMNEALRRMELGEDPDRIESEMGALLEEDDPFVLPGGKGKTSGKPAPPRKDETLYDL